MTALSKAEILDWLREDRSRRLQELYTHADDVRKQHVGDAVHLRGLIEISNHCVRQCMYCGLRRGNRELKRYRMSKEEIAGCVREAERLGFGTVVLQAGEDDELSFDWVADIVSWIKRETSLAVTLSLGERPEAELRGWREAGADRYLLRFETSDEVLYRAIHPQRFAGAPDRMMLLAQLKRLGYEAGGGVMAGIPGQSFESLAEDILAFRALDLDMIGIGPYIAHPGTPLGSGKLRPAIAPSDQAPNTETMVYKMIALARLACPTANIPSTTALATINRSGGRKQGLSVGGNVVMPNLTPMKYRHLYEIYPAKACIDESASDCDRCLRGQIHSLSRFVGRGNGSRGQFEVPLAAESLAPSNLVELEA